MKLSLNIVDRVYESIVQWCKQKNITVEDFCIKLIEDGFYVEKYGDLNQILSTKEEKKEKKNAEKKKTSEKKSETVKTVVETEKEEEVQPTVIDKSDDADMVRKIRRTIKAK